MYMGPIVDKHLCYTLTDPFVNNCPEGGTLPAQISLGRRFGDKMFVL